MSQLAYHLQPAAPADLAIRDSDQRLIAVIHVTPVYGATLEVVDFDRYGDYLGEMVKLTKSLKAAKPADLPAVKTVLDAAITYSDDAQPA